MQVWVRAIAIHHRSHININSAKSISFYWLLTDCCLLFLERFEVPRMLRVSLQITTLTNHILSPCIVLCSILSSCIWLSAVVIISLSYTLLSTDNDRLSIYIHGCWSTQFNTNTNHIPPRSASAFFGLPPSIHHYRSYICNYQKSALNC